MNDKTLSDILSTMDIPDMRCEINEGNLRWLLRNIKVRNSSHPMIKEVYTKIQQLILEINLTSEYFKNK